MQLKLLNMHKFLSNIAYEMVGAFVPLIVYQITRNLMLAMLFLLLKYFVSIVSDLFLHNRMEKHPQVFLILRVIPICLTSLFVMFLHKYFWLCFVGAVLCNALTYSFGLLPNNLTFNYSSVKSGSGASGTTIMVERVGRVIAVISGGLFLDYLSTPILIAISFAIYMLSCVPLVLYYVVSRKTNSLNKETTSNVMISFKENEVRNKAGKTIARKMLLSYGLTYFIASTCDIFLNVFNLFVYIKTGRYELNGYYAAMVNVGIAVGALFASKFEEKIDVTPIVCFLMFVSGVLIVAMPYISNIYALFAIVFVIGLATAGFASYLLNRVLIKTRILGVSNKAMLYNNEFSSFGYMVVFASCMFGSIIPGFVLCGVANVISAFAIPYNEEKTRKMLVKYLETGKIDAPKKRRKLKLKK